MVMWFDPVKSLSHSRRCSIHPYIPYCHETIMQVHCCGMFILASRCSVLWHCLLTKAVVTLGGPLHILRCSSSNQDYHVATIPSNTPRLLIITGQPKMVIISIYGKIATQVQLFEDLHSLHMSLILASPWPLPCLHPPYCTPSLRL